MVRDAAGAPVIVLGVALIVLAAALTGWAWRSAVRQAERTWWEDAAE